MQESLAVALGAADRFAGSGQAHFDAWLRVIARNQVHSAIRRRLLVREDEGVEPDAGGGEGSVAESLALRSGMQVVLGHLHELDERERMVLMLRWFGRVSWTTTTRLLDLRNERTARGIYDRARANFDRRACARGRE